ncbi:MULTISPECIES: carbohydrate ABC transporter permease [Arthrobacter]|nr:MULTISPECIES: carbohydrate ABC transporter permease [Arthrobacter]
MTMAALYFLIPIWWFVVASTKNNGDLFSTNAFWFSELHFFDNFRDLLTRQDGIFFRWMGNSFLYSIVGAVVSTAVSALAGYALAKYEFRGREAVFNTVLGATLMPIMLLTVPLYLLFSKIGIINTPWAVMIPLLISPFGIYLARIYAATIPDELLEAGRVDGAGELRIFLSIGMKIMGPALVTIFLLQFVGTWANYFLPMMMVSSPELQPLSVGIVTWQQTMVTGAAVPTNIVIFAAFISVLPLIALFLTMQRYWKAGLTAGGIK